MRWANNEEMMLRMLMGSSLDMPALLAFFGFAALYLIAPVIGYRILRPGAILLALYLLIGYWGLSILQPMVQWLQVIDRSGLGLLIADETAGAHISFLFMALKMVAFVAAMLAFVAGLRSMRLVPPRAEPTRSPRSGESASPGDRM